MYMLSQIEMGLGRTEEAGLLLKRAVDLNPQVGLSHWTLGLYYLLIGKKDEGKAEIGEAIHFGYKLNMERIQKLSAFYEKLNAYQDIVELYQEEIKIYPDNPQLHASLAATYAKRGEKEKARQETEIAIQLDPALRAEGEQFLESLNMPDNKNKF